MNIAKLLVLVDGQNRYFVAKVIFCCSGKMRIWVEPRVNDDNSSLFEGRVFLCSKGFCQNRYVLYELVKFGIFRSFFMEIMK